MTEAKKEILRRKARERYHRNRDKCLARSKAYQASHRDQVAEYRRKYQPILNKKRRENPNYKATRSRRRAHRFKTDPKYRLVCNLRARLLTATKSSGLKKLHTTMVLLGCGALEFQNHIESLWRPGMSWDNYGINGWHVDHKIPLASAQTIEDLAKLCHYTNLQPLWSRENMAKSDKIFDGN